MICALRNLKKTIILWVPLSLLFNPQVCPIYYPPYALTTIVNLSLILLYIANSNIKQNLNNELFGFKSFMYFMLFSCLVSSLFSVIPFNASLKQLVKSTIMDYGFVYIFFRCINDSDDIKLFIKSASVVAVLITVDAIIENFTHINLAGDFIFFTSPHTDDLFGRSFYYPFSVNGVFRERYGLTRCYSFFSIHIAFGIACAYLFFLFWSIRKHSWLVLDLPRKLQKHGDLLLIALLLVGVILSNSKTPLLGLFVLLFAYYRFSDIFRPWVWIPVILALVLIANYVPEYLNNIFSLFDEELAEEGGGSSVVMRNSQWSYILKMFEMSPLIGNGIASAQYFSNNVAGFEGILGAESIWFTMLADQGILGCIAYIYMFICIYNFCKKDVPSKVLFAYLASVMLMQTATGRVNFLLWLPVLIVIRKSFQIYNFKLNG